MRSLGPAFTHLTCRSCWCNSWVWRSHAGHATGVGMVPGPGVHARGLPQLSVQFLSLAFTCTACHGCRHGPWAWHSCAQCSTGVNAIPGRGVHAPGMPRLSVQFLSLAFMRMACPGCRRGPWAWCSRARCATAVFLSRKHSGAITECCWYKATVQPAARPGNCWLF